MQSPMIEYSPEPIDGAVEVRTSEECTSLVMRPTLWSVLRAVWTSTWLSLSAGAAMLFVMLIVRSGAFHWNMLLIPGAVAFISLLSTIPSLWIQLHAISFEVNAHSLIMKWRTLTEWKLQRWERASVVDVRAKKVRIPSRQILAHWGLVLRLASGPEMVILQALPRQLESIARELRKCMGISDEELPAMLITKPRRCPCLRIRYADGVMIQIPPKRERFFEIAIATILIFLATGLFALTKVIPLDPVIFPPNGVRDAVLILCLLMAAGLLWYGARMVLKRIRRTTTVFVGLQNAFVVETGLMRPMTVEWRGDQLGSITVTNTSGGKGALQLTPQAGHPLLLAGGHPAEDLEWMAAVLNAVRRNGQPEGTPARSEGSL